MTRTVTGTRTLAAAGLLTAGLVVGSAGGAVAGSMITGQQIKNGTITSADVRNKTLRTEDLTPSAIASLKKGGSASIAGYEVVFDSELVPYGTAASLSASCPAGKRVIGGSGYWQVSYAAVQFVIADGGGAATAYTDGIPATPGDTAETLLVTVVCAKVA